VGQAPGLESFAVQPEKPGELIKAIDYLIRVGLENQAVPLARKLATIKADDDTLDALRQTVGSAKLLALRSTNDPNLNDAMGKFVDRLDEASRKIAHDPNRVTRLISKLSATPEERDIAVELLARLGSMSIDHFLKELSAPDLTPEKRAQLQYALDRLESSAVPGLVGALRHPDSKVRGAVLKALANIGDPRALPWVVFEAHRPQGARQEAAVAVAALRNGTNTDNPVQYLISESARYLDRDVYFGDPFVEAWLWDDQDKSLKSLTLPAESARGAIGYRLARMALELDPSSEAAQTLIVSLLLDEETRRLGDAFPGEDPLGAWPVVLASGPKNLGYVLKRSLMTGRHENIAIHSARALGQIVRQSDITTSSGRPHVLIEAIDSPDRRVQFEAAKAIASAAPNAPFPGSSRVIPTLARFLRSNPIAPRAIVINDNVGKGSEWVSHLRSMGYDAVLETSSSTAFQEIATRSDVELILVSTFLDPAGWALHETVANFTADSRTSGIPLIVVGPLNARDRLSTLLSGNSKVGFMVDPADESWARRQIEGQLARLPRSELSSAERQSYSDEAARLLGRFIDPGQPSIFLTAVNSIESVTKNKIVSNTVTTATDRSKARLDSLFATLLANSTSEQDRIKAADSIADILRTSAAEPDSEQRKALYDLFMKKENGKDHELEGAIGRLVGLTAPTPEDVARFFSKYAPGANFYETVRDSEASGKP
jgi:HEAT repeat protein